MKTLKLLVLLTLLLPTLLIAQNSKVFDNLTIESKILKSQRKFAIYLPPNYETSQRSYPVLYLLHGAGDDQTGWVQFGEIQHITDQCITNGTATSMIVVMPDANTGQRGYFNDFKNEWRYEDFFFDELIPFIEKNYRVKSEKRFRAISGLSMGGGGTFMYALHRPEMFSSACPLSAYIGPLTLSDARLRLGIKDEKATDQQVEAYFNRHNAIKLIENQPNDKRNAVRWYIDCGDDDFLYEGNSLVHIAMKKKEIPHEFRIRNGGHTWSYWRESLPEVLKFVSEAFHQY